MPKHIEKSSKRKVISSTSEIGQDGTLGTDFSKDGTDSSEDGTPRTDSSEDETLTTDSNSSSNNLVPKTSTSRNKKRKLQAQQDKSDNAIHDVIDIDDSDDSEVESKKNPSIPGPSFINFKKNKTVSGKDASIETNENKDIGVSKQFLDPEVFKNNVIAKLRKDLAASHDKNKLLSQSADNYKKLVSELHSSVECPVCLDLPDSAPIPICPNGHVVCTACVTRTPTCPTCRVRMGEGTSPIAVTIIENIPHACKYQFSGCEFTCMLPHLKSHLKLCPFRTVTCPNIKCWKSVPLSELADHTLAKCIYKGTFLASPFGLSYDFKAIDFFIMVGVAFDENIFFLHIRRKRETPGKLYFFVQMIGTENQCSQYVALHVLTEVGGLSSASKQFVNQICPIDISTLDEAIAGGYCGEIDNNIMKFILCEEVVPTDENEKKLQFNINIQLKLQRKDNFEKDLLIFSCL